LKQTVGAVGGGLNNAVKFIGNGVQQVANAVRPYAGMAADVVSTFNPALGQGLKAGFNVVDSVSRGASKGGIKGAIGGGIKGASSILNRGKEPPEVWQDDDDDEE
jgi:hypothetical protein